jgi:hypothetical protein
MTTIIIKQNQDKNYDRLFKRVERTVLFPRDAVSLSERETAEGYAVEFRHLDADVIAWAEGRPSDFEVR